MKEIAIGTENIELGKFLKYSGAVQSGGQAKQWIEGGRIAVNGNIETRRHKKLVPGDVVRCDGREYRVIP